MSQKELQNRLEYLFDCREELSISITELDNKINDLKTKFYNLHEQRGKVSDEIEDIKTKLKSDV